MTAEYPADWLVDPAFGSQGSDRVALCEGFLLSNPLLQGREAVSNGSTNPDAPDGSTRGGEFPQLPRADTEQFGGFAGVEQQLGPGGLWK